MRLGVFATRSSGNCSDRRRKRRLFVNRQAKHGREKIDPKSIFSFKRTEQTRMVNLISYHILN